MKKRKKVSFSLSTFKEAFFSLDSSPHKRAISFAIGVFIAFNPTYGLHTVEVFVIAGLFRLNLPLLFIGAWLNNPWTLVPISTFCYFVGRWVLQPLGFAYDPDAWGKMVHVLTHAGWREWFSTLPPMLLHQGIPFVVGSLITATVVGVLTYFVSLAILTRWSRTHGEKETIGSGYKA